MSHGEITRLLFEFDAAGKWAALVGDSCANLAFPRAAVKVGIDFVGAQLADRALDSNLPAKALPVKTKGCLGIFGKLAPLLAFNIGKEAEAIVAYALDEDHADAGLPARGCRGEGCGVWVVGFVLRGLLEPRVEERKRVLDGNFIFNAGGLAAHGPILGAGFGMHRGAA